MRKSISLMLMFLGLATLIWGQDFYDINTVNTIHLYFTQTNWDQILDNLYAQGEERLIGTAIINGVTYDSVGVRYKGNSSYNANRTKNPFNIKLDHVIEDQLIGPYGTIKLANGFSDPSLVRETLSYEIARKYMPASRANYANVYVNNVLIGVYTSVQDVDSYYMNEHFHTSGQPRFKSGTNSMSAITVWGYLGTNPSSYDVYYDLESDEGWDTLIGFTNVLQNTPANIAQVMNVDQNLWMCAFDNLLVNLDSPINIFHNFYLFADADGRINPLLWDLNMSFGGFPSGTVTQMQQLDPLRNINSNTFLLIKNVLSNARYKKMYLAHMRTMIEENFVSGWYATRAAQLQAICGPSVQADPNYFYTYANFLANVNTSVTGGTGPGGMTVPGITQLMNARASYLLNNSNFAGTVPSLVSHDHTANPEPGDNVQFTLNVANASYAQLGIRQNHARKFNYHQMFDDGAHGDGAAGDGVYGVSVPISTGDVEYFFWAENTSQGMFFPPRAEYEFYSFPVASTTGEIVINEIMAKNASYTDPFGEFDDWVELYNPNNYPVDIGGMYMTDNHYANGITAWTQIPTGQPAITTIPANGYLIVWFDEDLDQGPLHINDKLGGGADGVYLISSDGQTLIDSYVWTEATDLNVDDRSIGRSPDGAPNWVLFGAGQPNPCTPGSSNAGNVNSLPVISNIDYSPYPSPADGPVTISATLADQDSDTLTATLLWKLSTSETFTNAPMTVTGSSCSAAIGPFPLDTQINFRVQVSDQVNNPVLSPQYNIIIGFEAPTLYVNELMPSNSSTVTDNAGEYEDWLEIYNPNPFPVDLAGYYLTDNHFSDPNFSFTRIPYGASEQTTIPAHGFIIIWFDEHLDQGPLHINTKLGTAEDAVYLIAPDMLRVIDQTAWVSANGLAADVSFGRYPDGGGTWQLFGAGQALPATPGANNGPTDNDDPNIPSVKPSLSVYPNPMRSSLTIELKNSRGPAILKIYNLKGQLVRQMETSAKQIWDGRDQQGRLLGNGVYFLSVEADGQRLSSKICIMK